MRTPRPEDHLKLEGDRDFRAEYYESFLGQPVERTPERRPRYAIGSMDNIHLGDDGWVSIHHQTLAPCRFIAPNDRLICEPFPHP